MKKGLIADMFGDVKKLFNTYGCADLECVLYSFMRYGRDNLSIEEFNKLSETMETMQSIFNEELNEEFDFLMED